MRIKYEESWKVAAKNMRKPQNEVARAQFIYDIVY